MLFKIIFSIFIFASVGKKWGKLKGMDNKKCCKLLSYSTSLCFETNVLWYK